MPVIAQLRKTETLNFGNKGTLRLYEAMCTMNGLIQVFMSLYFLFFGCDLELKELSAFSYSLNTKNIYGVMKNGGTTFITEIDVSFWSFLASV